MINIPLYFNFLLELIKYYHGAIKEQVLPFIESLVHRIIQEVKNCHAKGEKNNIIINKCWNVIRQISEITSLLITYYDQIEE